MGSSELGAGPCLSIVDVTAMVMSCVEVSMLLGVGERSGVLLAQACVLDAFSLSFRFAP